MAINQKLAELKAKQEQWEREFQQRLAEMRAEEEALTKASEAAEKLVSAVKKIGLDPVLAYEILIEAELIQAPVLVSQDREEEGELLGLFVFDPIKEGGRSSSFKFTKGLNVNQLQAVKKGRWAQIKAKGKDYFLSNLNAAGKAWLATEEGQEFMDRHFPVAAPV